MFTQPKVFFCYCFFLSNIFIIKKLFYNTHQVRCYHFFIVEIIVESVNLIEFDVKIEYFVTMIENN